MRTLNSMIVVTLYFAFSVIRASSSYCFEGSKFPKILGSKEELISGRDISQYMAVTGNDTSIYVGGYTKDTQIGQSSQGGAVISRIDLAWTNTVWQM